MGWYGKFLVPELKLAFSLRSTDEGKLHDDFYAFEMFFDRYEKLKEDIDYIQGSAEESKSFSAKVTSKMFNFVDKLSYLPEVSDSVFLL